MLSINELWTFLPIIPLSNVHFFFLQIDDCVSGLTEAHEAGCWAVGVARYGNYMDIDSFEQEAILTEEEIQVRLLKARKILAEGGAHYVIDSVADLPEVVDDINQRLAKGEKPWYTFLGS